MTGAKSGSYKSMRMKELLHEGQVQSTPVEKTAGTKG